MGNVRSATCTRILNARGYNSIAVGWLRTPSKTLNMLGRWADIILYLDSKANLGDCLLKFAPKPRRKIKDMDIGYDKWGTAMDKDLVKVIKKGLHLLSLN